MIDLLIAIIARKGVNGEILQSPRVIEEIKRVDMRRQQLTSGISQSLRLIIMRCPQSGRGVRNSLNLRSNTTILRNDVPPTQSYSAEVGNSITVSTDLLILRLKKPGFHQIHRGYDEILSRKPGFWTLSRTSGFERIAEADIKLKA
jgi:hypothetical protein